MGMIECPVCTLYLRADMSLEEHLETHPTEKVIKALVSMATKNASGASTAASAALSPANSDHPTPMDLIPVTASSSRARTPPNALMYHNSGYELSKQIAPPPPPPPPKSPILTNPVPTAITVVKASDVGYHPLNNLMIVKSCSAKFVQQMQTGNGPGEGSGTTTATYTQGPIDNRSIFIEPDRGGPSITVRRQMAPSLYPRYTNERYSGPPPPYSTAISSTISASSQLQQSSITGFTSKYEQKPVQAQQQTFYSNYPSGPLVAQTTHPTITISQQQHQQPIYHAALPQSTTVLAQQTVALEQQSHPHHLQAPIPYKGDNLLQAQYTEKEDGNFIVTENPKKVVEYTENEEGEFMVIEKIVKSPPRILQFSDDNEPSAPLQPATPEQLQELETDDGPGQELYQAGSEPMEEEQQQAKEIPYKENLKGFASEASTIEIVENEDGTFDDNRGPFGIKEMPKPILIGNVGSSKKCNKFNFIVESSSTASGNSSNSCTPRKKPASGLKVLSNVKVTTDLSQGIKDIILNLNCKNKTATVAGSSGNTATVDGIKTSLIAGVKSAAVVNNNCQNELIINTGGNMPPIDLNNVNDIEIINDDEEDVRSGEDEECYIGSMEVKVTNTEQSQIDKEPPEAGPSQNSINTSRNTPTPSVITSVIRMTPHSSPVVASSPPPQTSHTPTASAVPEEEIATSTPAQEQAVANVSSVAAPSKCSFASSDAKTSGQVTARKSTPAANTAGYTSGPLFNKQPKKLTVKLKRPLPPAPPQSPPLTSASHAVNMVVPKVENLGAVVPKKENCLPENVDPTQHNEGGITTSNMQSDRYGDGLGGSSSQAKISTSAKDLKIDQLDVPLPNNTAIPLVTSKIEQECHLSETISIAQSTTHTEHSIVTNESVSNFQSGLHSTDIHISTTSEEVVRTTSTEIECYNITFIDDENDLDNRTTQITSTIAAHEVVEHNVEYNSGSLAAIVKPEYDIDDKTNIPEMCNLKINDQHSMSPYGGSQSAESENVDSPESDVTEQRGPMLESRIKIEKEEKISNNEFAELVSNTVDNGNKLIDHTVAKIEPNTTVTSSLSACTSVDYQKQKDLLEAGPSRTVTTGDDGSASHSQMAGNAPTFLEYSAEYDDYVPVSGYGIPQEQIPLSWVQKFSPQYTPFDDQNSYMDLDMCSSKTNSNSVGCTSAVSGNGSGSSASRLDASMDRAPSADSLNIRTDEKMPAKGEISEQESNGDMELSWNRLYPVHENIPIYPSSYDLSTAQECWNLSNRNTSAHNNSSSSNTSNNNAGAAHHEHQLSSHHNYQHPLHAHQGNNFQFPQTNQQRHVVNVDDDQADDKSKIHMDYGAGSSGTSYLGLGPSSSAMQDNDTRKLVKVRTYRCTECPKSFALLKQRRAHMLSEHAIDSKVNVLGSATATVTSTVSATVTSGAALGFFSSPGEGSSSTILNKKIKIEPVLMSYSSLKQELELKQEGGVVGEVAGPSSELYPSGEIRRKRIYVCGTCKQQFDRFKLFNAHLLTHPAECYACGRSFKHWPNFALHIKRHLGIKDHQCKLCGKRFVIKQKLIEHMRVHTGKAPIKCPDCDQHFRRFSNLAQHRNRHHLNRIPSKKDFVCHCGEVFQSKAKMEWHKEIHENRPKSCPFCREKFIHKNSLTRHIRLSHTEKYIKLETATEICTICNQPYIKTSMKRHMETHTDERMAYSCTICNKLFSTNWNLKQHKWTHANPTLKPFQCNMCSSGFVREADYITHMNAHKSIRPYTCNHCGCQFIRKYNWIRHTREHETDKNYTCEICGRKFHRKYYLTEHKRIHTGERPFSCNICGKTSSTKTNHNKHIKIHHARDPLTAEG